MPSIPVTDFGEESIRTLGHVVRKAFKLVVTGTSQYITSSGSWQASGTSQYAALEARSSSLGANPNFNAGSILLQQQRFQLQIIAATFASVSVLATICALYWFMMMRRNFRRDLVLLLVAGDFWKSSWFVITASTKLSGIDVGTNTTLCQASGYFLQTGIESCDLAIFLMSLHMSLQIFPPSRSFLGHDGLYRIRYYVLAAWVIIPLGIAAFAFINSGPAFISQGGFCSLPIRPFWYRLALSWIPRYLNWLFVMGVAVRIYRHVGYEFKVFGDESDHSSSAGGIPGMSGGTQRSSRLAMGTMNTQTSHLEPADAAGVEKSAVRDEDVAPDQRGSLVWDLKKPSPPSSARTRDVRRQSVPTFTSVFGGGPAARNDVLTEMETINRHISQSTPNSRRGSKQDASGAQIGVEDFAPLPPLAPPRHYGSSSTINSRKSSTYDSSQPSPLAPIEETKPSIASLSRDNVATRALQLRRKAIQRQLRLLFIYPVVYLILWIMPFVAHALSYSDYYAQNPIYPVSVLNIFCQCIMGLVDVCIFCWREKPWHHVPGSDGTFIGSFKFWRFGQEPNWSAALPRNHPDSTLPSIVPPATDEEEDARQLTSPEGLVGSIKRWSAVRSFSSRTSASHPASRSEDPPSTTSPRKLPPPVIVAPRSHRRTHSDRRVLEAERAQERLALERSEALSQQQFRREAQEARETGAGSEVQGELGGGFVAAQPVSPPKEWWDRHLSTVGSILSEEDGEGRK